MSEPTHEPPPAPAIDDEELLGQLADDFAVRRRRGEHPTFDEYIAKHPPLAERIRKVLSAVGMMEQTVSPDLAGGERPGRTIGRYKLLERIGEGGFGVVYMAEQLAPVRRKVALKVIKPGMDSRQVLARFDAERQALAIMDHPNIAKVFDGGMTDSGRPYFVMELVKGEPITTYCDNNHLPPRARLELFAQVCHAVQHAHQKGIIHRDLKPTNVLVATHDTTPVVKVIDFGVAKALGQELTDNTLFTGFAQLLGTPLYMSPEQAGQSSLDIDTRSDIYSLGVLLYELLTGTTPFDKERFRKAAQDEIRRIIREEEPPRPSTRLSESKDRLPSISAQRHTEPAKLTKLVRGELDWIVMKALEKDRNRRYETANGFARDIERYLHDESVQACPPSTAYRLKKFLRRNRGPVTAVAAVLLVLLVGVIVSTWQAIRIRAEQKNTLAQKLEADRQREEAQQQRAAAERKEKQSKAVIDFINSDVFAGATPERMPDLKVRNEIVAKMLEPAAKAVHERFQDQPLVRAAVMHQIALSYQKLGRGAEAAPLIKDAMEIRRSELGPDHNDTLNSQCNYAVVLRGLGRLPEAKALLEDAVARHRRLRGHDDARTLAAVTDYANVLHSMKRLSEAEPLFRDVLERRRRILGDDHLDTIQSASHYAFLLVELGRCGEALPLHKDVLERRRRVLGEDHPLTLQAINGYAHALNYMNHNAEAEPLFRDALERRRRVLGDDHPDTITSIMNYAGVMRELHRLPESQRLYEESIERRRRLVGEDHPVLLRTMDQYALLLQAMGRTAEAAQMHKEVVERRRRVLGEYHSDTEASACAYFALLQSLGRADEADVFVKTTFARIQARQNIQQWAVSARGLAAEGQFADAEAAWRKHLELTKKVDPSRIPASLHGLAGALRDEKKLADAEEVYREALAIQRRTPPTTRPTLFDTLASLGSLLCDAEKAQQAEAVLRECLTIGEASGAGDSARAGNGDNDGGTAPPAASPYEIAEVQSLLAEAIVRQQRFADAEPFLLAACEVLGGAPVAWQLERRASYQRAADLYQRWGKSTQAAHWQEQLAALPPIDSAALNKKAEAARLAYLKQLNGQAYSLRRDGKLEEARQVRLQVIEKAKAAYPRGDSKTIGFQRDYVELLHLMQRYEEERNVVLEILAAVGNDKAQQIWGLKRLVLLHNDWQKPQEAEAYRQQLLRLDPTSTWGTTRPSSAPATTGASAAQPRHRPVPTEK